MSLNQTNQIIQTPLNVNRNKRKKNTKTGKKLQDYKNVLRGSKHHHFDDYTVISITLTDTKRKQEKKKLKFIPKKKMEEKYDT